jgi:copper(I)-binding protein
MARFFTAFLIALTFTYSAGAQTPVAVEAAWSRAQIAGRSGVVYLTLVGKGMADRLTSASSPVAERVEIHATSMDQGVMKMRELAAIAVPAEGQVVLAPGGTHIMLIGLRQALNAGDHVTLRLVFEKSGVIEVSAPVTKAGAAAARDHHR